MTTVSPYSPLPEPVELITAEDLLAQAKAAAATAVAASTTVNGTIDNAVAQAAASAASAGTAAAQAASANSAAGLAQAAAVAAKAAADAAAASVGKQGPIGPQGPAGSPSTVNGKTGSVITLEKSDLGLGNVANLSPAQMIASGPIADAVGSKAAAVKPLILGGKANQNLLIGPRGDGNPAGIAMVSVVDGATANAPLDLTGSIVKLNSDITMLNGGKADANLMVGKIGANSPGVVLISGKDDFSAVYPLNLQASEVNISGKTTFDKPPVFPAGVIEKNVTHYGAIGDDATDSTAAFTAHRDDPTQKAFRIPSGTFRIAPMYLGEKPIIIQPDTYLKNLDGTPTTSAMYGGLQVGTGVASVNNRKATFNSLWGNVKYEDRNFGVAGAGSAAMHECQLVYNGLNTNGYSVTAVNYSASQAFGFVRPSNGSGALYIGSVLAGNIAVGTEGGRTEITPIAIGANCQAGYDQNNVNMYYDFNISGPITRQECILGGITSNVQKRNPIRTHDDMHQGAYAFCASTQASGAGFGTPEIAATTTYPLDAMYAAAGWTGPSGTPNGTHANADFAAVYGFLAGGGPNSVWIPSGARSKFVYGMGLMDWKEAGLRIKDRHPEGAGPGIDCSDYPIWGSEFRADAQSSMTVLGGNPVWITDSGDYVYYARASNQFTFTFGGVDTHRISATGTFLKNTASAPATPTSGGMLFVQNGALKYIGSSGTVTTLANP